MPSEADKRRAVAASRRDRPDPRAAAARQPDVRRGVPARACAHAAEHHRALRLAGRQVRRRRRRRDRRSAAIGGGTREIWRAQYLAGCDGGRSFVRRSLALRYQRLRQARLAALRRAHERDLFPRADALSRSPRPPPRLALLGRSIPRCAATIITLNERRRIPGVLQGRRTTARRRPTTSMAQIDAARVGADLPIRSSAIGRGPRASRWWPSASSPAASSSPATPRICSRRPAASA